MYHFVVGTCRNENIFCVNAKRKICPSSAKLINYVVKKHRETRKNFEKLLRRKLSYRNIKCI